MENKTGYIYNQHSGLIEETKYFDYLDNFGSDETTSPRGVENREHIMEKSGIVYVNDNDPKDQIFESEYDLLDEEEQQKYSYLGETTQYWEVWTWGTRGQFAVFVEQYDTEEEAKMHILKSKEWYVREKNWDAPRFFDTKEEAIREFADGHEKSFEVAERYFSWKKGYEARQKAEQAKACAEVREKKRLLQHELQMLGIENDAKLKAEVSEARKLTGKQKSDAIAKAFGGWLERSGKTVTDFWGAWRLVSEVI